MDNEKDLSAKQPPTQEEARVPCSDENARRSQGTLLPPSEGAAARRGLKVLRLPRWRRLRQRGEFQRVYGAGVRVSGRWLVMFGQCGDDEGPARLGITASRRVGGAVTRNRCKRRIRELYRLGFPAGRMPIDLVVNARAGCESVPWSQLVVEFGRCVKRLQEQLGVWSPSSEPTRGGSLPSCRRRAASHQLARNTQRKRSYDTES